VLDAVEQNVRTFLAIGGHRVGRVTCHIDTSSGTASIHHHKGYDGATNCEVYLPALPAATRLTRQEVDRWISYFIHELCHAFFTDEAAWASAVREGLHVLVNAMEDPRIETVFNRLAIAANSTALLTTLMNWCVGNLPVDYDPNDMRNFPWLLAMVGRVEICGYEMPEARAHMAKMKPTLAAFVAVIMGKLRAAQNTGDVLDIARWIKAELTKAAKKTNPGEGARVNPGKAPKGEPGKAPTGEPGEPGEGEASEPGEPGEGEPGKGATEAREPEAGETASKGETASGWLPKGEGEGEGEGKAGEGEAGSGAGEPGDEPETPADPLDGMKPVDLNPVSDKLREIARSEISGATANAEAETIEGIRAAQKAAGQELVAASRGGNGTAISVERLKRDALKCGKLRQHVARVLKAEENETWSRSRPSGRLDRFAYVRIAAGVTENVFMRRHISGGYETEIIVLIDGSGSMSGTPLWTSGVLAYVIAQAAAQVGVNAEIIRFSTGKFESVKDARTNPGKAETQRRFAALSASGSTPLSRSIIRASARLAARAPAKRKLLFVVSDGDCDGGPKAVKRACVYAASRDVETVALCIDMEPHAGFAHAVSCRSSNIAEAGLGALVRVLARHE
jgi:Mg-chelatase subunit ChlD